LAPPYKIQSLGICTLLIGIVFVVLAIQSVLTVNEIFMNTHLKSLKYRNKNYLFIASMDDFGLSFG